VSTGVAGDLKTLASVTPDVRIDELRADVDRFARLLLVYDHASSEVTEILSTLVDGVDLLT
jgi:hypothetical protein